MRNAHLRSLTAVVVTLVGGIALFWIFRGILAGITPGWLRASAGFSLSAETAQLGVCFSLWALTWGLLWGAWPTRFAPVVNRLVRTGIVAVLAVGTYVGYMHGFATQVLHFPAVQGSYGGNPLLTIDWVILFVLWYAVAFGGYGSTRAARTGGHTA